MASRPDRSSFALKINPNIARSFESSHWKKKDSALNPYLGQYFFTFPCSLLEDQKVLYKYEVVLDNLSGEFDKAVFPSFHALGSE